MKDLHNNLAFKVALAPAATAVADNTAQVGEIIDRAGYESLEFAIATGTLADADATFAVLVEEGDKSDLSDAAAVDDKHLLGTEALAGFKFDEDKATKKVGYVGAKRYVRITITPATNTGAAPMAAVAILGNPRHLGGDAV